MRECRVVFDADAMQHTIEFAPVGPTSRRVESGDITAWIGDGGVEMLVVDRGLDGTMSPITAGWVAGALGQDVQTAVLDCRNEVTLEIGDEQMTALTAAVDDLAVAAGDTDLVVSGDPSLRATDSAPIVLRSGDSRELSGDAWVPVGVERADLPLDTERPATVMWRPPTGEFIVRLPTVPGGTWPGELWLRVTEEPEGWVIAAAPVAPNGEAHTIVARPEATFDGLRVDVGRNVSEGTALDARRSRERLASLAAVATEAEQAGDFATAAAAWTAAAAFADELLDDSAAERFRHRASETATSHSKSRPSPSKKRWWLVIVLVAMALVLLAVGAWIGTDDTDAGVTPTSGSPVPSVETTAPPETSAETVLDTTTSSTTTTLLVPSGPVRSVGVFSQDLGQGHGPLASTLEIEVTTPVVPIGGSVEVAIEFTYDDVGPYPANLYDECLAAVGKSRSTGGFEANVPAYVVVARAGDVEPDALGTYLVDLPLSAFRDIGITKVPLLDSQILDCGERPPADVGFQVDQHLIYQIYTASIDVSDLGPGTYVLIPMMTATLTNPDGLPEAVDGPLVGFTVA